jgi:D-tyrosyl-tRNA(Tyr) deacylase
MVRCVIQRVSSASVEVDGSTVGSIGRGLMVLVGIEPDDTQDDIDWMTKKISNVRLFPDGNGRPWKKSVRDLGLQCLLVSQFTLHARIKGSQVDFRGSMAPGDAGAFFERFVSAMRAEDRAGERGVETGVFGAAMAVRLVNDGPVTITLDSQTVGFKRRIKRPTEVAAAKKQMSERGSGGGALSKSQQKKAAKRAAKAEARADTAEGGSGQ